MITATKVGAHDPRGGSLVGVIPDWMDSASCAQTDAEAFFPSTDGDHLGWNNIAAAKKVCAGCPVRTVCLAYALEHGIRDGIWGGLTTGERRRVKRGAA